MHLFSRILQLILRIKWPRKTQNPSMSAKGVFHVFFVVYCWLSGGVSLSHSQPEPAGSSRGYLASQRSYFPSQQHGLTDWSQTRPVTSA